MKSQSSPAGEAPSRHGLSLRWKLPLAASVLLILLVALYTWVGYREVATSARVGAGERNIALARELARISTSSSLARARLVAGISNQPAVHAALTSGDTMAVDTALEALRLPADSILSVILYNANRQPIRFIGVTPDPEVLSHAQRLFDAAERRDSLSVTGPLIEHGGGAHFWTVARVRSGGRTLGFVGQFRAVRTSPETSRTMKALLGVDNRLLFGNRDTVGSKVAATLDGELIPPREEERDEEGYKIYTRKGVEYIAATDTIAGGPFRLVVETPVASTQARANEFLMRTGVLGLLLLITSTIVIWLVSRRFTRPIAELSEAAGAIARGDYDRRVEVARGDELGTLGSAFNRMIDQIQRSMAVAQSSRAEAERANRAKSEFLANMSHEIRTPINAMLGYADLIEAGISGPVTDQQKHQLERIRLSGIHLNHLINDLLDFARLETAQLSVSRRVAPASEAIDTALTVVNPQALSKSLMLTKHIDGDPHYVGDPQRVEQILVNLIGNAIKFTPSDGQVRVECRSVTSNGGSLQTEFVVEDTGIGIPSDRLEAVFEPFVQGHAGYTKPHGGSGLGLTISRRLTEAMGGRIRVESEEGRGSRFIVTLPAPG